MKRLFNLQLILSKSNKTWVFHYSFLRQFWVLNSIFWLYCSLKVSLYNILYFVDCSCNLQCACFSGITFLFKDKLYPLLLSLFIINNHSYSRSITPATMKSLYLQKVYSSNSWLFFLKHWHHSKHCSSCQGFKSSDKLEKNEENIGRHMLA